MRRPLTAMAVLALLAACRGSRRSNAEIAAAVKSCGDAFGEIAASGSFTNATAIYARGCHDLYSEPDCRRAVARLADVSPDDRLAMVARDCAKAYCGKLDAPAPKLCGSGSLPPDDEIDSAWQELDERILRLELGSDAPGISRVAGAMTRTTKVVALPRPPAETTALATDHIALALVGDRVSVAVAGRTWNISNPPTPAELASIVAAVDHTHQVVLHVPGDLKYGTAGALMTALRDAGVTHIALTTN